MVLVQLDLVFVVPNEVVLVLFLPVPLSLSVFEVIDLNFGTSDHFVDESIWEHIS